MAKKISEAARDINVNLGRPLDQNCPQRAIANLAENYARFGFAFSPLREKQLLLLLKDARNMLI